MQTFNPDNCLKAHFSSPSARLATLLFRFLLVILHILHLNVFGKLRIMRIFYFSTSCLPLKSNKYRIKYKINEFPADYNCTLPNNRQYFSLFYLNCTKLFNQICFSCLREELKVFPIRIRFKKTFAVSCFLMFLWFTERREIFWWVWRYAKTIGTFWCLLSGWSTF